MKNLCIILFLVFFSFQAYSQEKEVVNDRYIDQTSLGIGMGLDLGGFGMNFTFYPVKNLGLFGGVGYALAGVGFNAGAKLRIIPKKPTTNADFFLLAMGGYNAAIAVSGATQYNKLFYGPTFGAGFDLRLKHQSPGYLTLALLVPVRSSEVDKYMTDLENNHDVAFNNKLIPLGISISYRFIISNFK